MAKFLSTRQGVSLIEKYLTVILTQIDASGIDQNDLQQVDSWLSARFGIEKQLKLWP